MESISAVSREFELAGWMVEWMVFSLVVWRAENLVDMMVAKSAHRKVGSKVD